MKRIRTALLIAAGALLLGGAALPGQDKDHGNGHGKGHDKHKHGDDDRDESAYYRQDYRNSVHEWYGEHYRDLPPGLAKRDRLPPGLEKQLMRNGSLPPGLQKKLYRCPEDLERRLPPPPPDCRHVLIGGHLILLNVRTNVVMDFLHIELY